MGLIARTDTVQPPNNPPEWTGAITASWTDGVGGTTDLDALSFDQEGDSLTYTHDATSTSLPTGVSISGSDLVGSTSVVEGTTTGIRLKVDDGTASPVASDDFSIVIDSDRVRAYLFYNPVFVN